MQSLEELENPFMVLGINSDSIVGDAKDPLAVFLLGGDVNSRRGALRYLIPLLMRF
jgi:hypothetical protein